ncbi:hypothetical protein [Thermincola ferriacetica]
MAVHDIIRHCLNYKYEITEKFIAKMLPKPVSCPRLREEYRSLTAQLGCDCRLHVPPGGYPSPILHANKTATAGQAIKPTGKSVETAGGDEAAIAKLTERLINIKKQQKQLDKAMARVFESFGCLMDKANSDRLDLEIGTLIRKRDNDRVEWVIQL